jgi:hypothetical protein
MCKNFLEAPLSTQTEVLISFTRWITGGEVVQTFNTVDLYNNDAYSTSHATKTHMPPKPLRPPVSTCCKPGNSSVRPTSLSLTMKARIGVEMTYT